MWGNGRSPIALEHNEIEDNDNPHQREMSDNTAIFIQYNEKEMGYKVVHASWDEQSSAAIWEKAEVLRPEGFALRCAVKMYTHLKDIGVEPEYGITPLYDPNNLIPREQTTLEMYEVKE